MSVRRFLRRFFLNQRGAAALEFALVAPALVLLIIGILVLGWAFHCESSVRFALAQSARALQLNNNLSTTQVETLVQQTLETIADSNVTIAVVVDTPHTGVKVAHLTATYTFAFSLPFFSAREVKFSDTAAVVLSVS